MSVMKYKDPSSGEWVKVGGIFSDGSGNDTIPEYVRAEAERVAKLVQSRQNPNTITFFACSDTHYYSPDNATAYANAAKIHEAVVSMGQAMGLIREQVHIDFAAMLGDMTWDSIESGTDEVLSEMRFVNVCLSEGFGNLPQFRMEGNHDDAYESGMNLTAAQIFANIGAWNDGAVYGDRASGYCYRDFEGVKLRVIALNSSQYSGSAAQFNPEQITWLAKALDLSNKGADWRSIILSHHPLDWGRNGGTDPTSTINAASGLIASFHGHIHNFLTGTVTNTELPRISIPNAGYSRENQYGESYGINWKEGTTYSKTPGTVENTSFCVVTIDLAEKKIYADHYGAGYDRIIPYDGAELNTFTVTNHLTHVSNSNQSAVVNEGSAYSATLTADDGYAISSVTVTMGGNPVAVSGSTINIASVTGNIVITATAVESPTGGNYTNLVPKATTTPGGTEIYDGKGYKDGYYVSSGQNFNADAACVAVGFIPFKTDDVIYIRCPNADITTNSHVRFYTYYSDGDTQLLSATLASVDADEFNWVNGNGTVMATVNRLGERYYKLTPSVSEYTGNHYYRISLYGTGEGLIITHNEPIE